MSEPVLFSIIIPNWNGLKHLPPCLNALRAQSHHHLEIILADNASVDGSQAFIAREYPEVKLVQLPKNRGFTGACNAGLQAATGEFLCLLNNDTEVAPDWAAEVIACFERHPEAGMVASRMMLFEKRDHFHTAGDFYGVNGYPGNRGAWQRDEGQFAEEEYVFSACGGSSVYRRVMLDQVGLLDDDFFFSMEDVDLGWRAQLSGWKCVYAPRAVVYHHLAATGGGTTSSFYDGRNAIYVLIKDYPTPLFRKYWRRVLGKHAGIAWEALRAWRGKAARAKLRGIATGLVHLPMLLRKRRAVQKTRRVTIDYLESILSH
ncbi:Poly-beta-1,6-N-acetyl-D-glucosamine synthase [Anaerolineae bacterium]|nr:Poly-beta-1,6-N-acetyl-D-glucosamine synthase [Anaerolineae bacterium]